MTKMSTGDDATLGNYRKMAAAVFGEYSKPVKFLDDKIAASPDGANEEVIADERQVVYMLGTMTTDKTDAAPRCTEQQLIGIRDSLLTLGITGDSLFDRIREDIERGLIREARTHLNFVDIIVNANGKAHGRSPVHPLVGKSGLEE